jgi:putative Mn2+ efflux pump MntP
MLTLVVEVLTIGLILSADSFSAAIAMGMRPFTRSDAIKFALSSGGAEAGVALIGALAGSKIISRFGHLDHWIAFILLMGVALHMAHEGYEEFNKKKNDLDDEEKQNGKKEFHSFTKIIIVSFATSLDALGVGIGLGVSKKPILPFIISIGAWAFISTIAGMNLASKLSKNFGPIINFLGAIVLIVIAFSMLNS